MRLFLGTEIKRQREGRGMRIQNGLPDQSSTLVKVWRLRVGRDAELDPYLARVRREQKVTSKGARFGGHFTQMYGVQILRIIL